MSSKIEISHKFEPFFELLQGGYPEVDTVLMTGGRASGKSFNTAIFSLVGSVQYDYKVLYSRFTNHSIGDSIKAEVSSKIELLGFDSLVVDNKYDLECTNSKGSIAFKGIKTGSKNQTANLKSLSGFNLFVVDEAEEIPDYETFKKVYYSIRSNDKRNLSVLILNPSTKEHWIFKEFFEKKDVDSGFCGVVDNVMYVHSSYLDAPEYAIPENIKRDYDRMKIDEPEMYDNIVMGGWVDQLEGVMFKKSELNTYIGADFKTDSEEIDAKTSFIDIADTGEDHLCMPIGFNIGSKVFIHDVVFTQEGSGVTPKLCADKMNEYKLDYTRIESNMGGTMYKNLLAPHLKADTEIYGARAKANKHTRITMMAGSIKKYCYFRTDYAKGSDYDMFMKALCSYLRNNENKHDDAPDALSGLLYFIRRQLPHLYEGDFMNVEESHYSEG
jgi:PBSX family phage terminase large subunit